MQITVLPFPTSLAELHVFSVMCFSRCCNYIGKGITLDILQLMLPCVYI